MLNSIRGKMILYIALPTTLIYLVALGFALFFAYEQSRQEVKDQIIDLAETSASRFNDYIGKAAQVAETTARFIENSPQLTESQIYAILEANVIARKRVYGSAMAFEPGTFKADNSLFCPYVYKGDGATPQRMNIGRDVLDWYSDPQWQWWSRAKSTQKPIWTDPYFDKGAGNILMTTYSVPFFKEKEFSGVVTIDLDLLGLKHEVGDLIAAKHNFFIMTKTGQFVYSPISEHIVNSTIVEIAEENGSSLVEGAQRIISGESGFLEADGVFQNERKLIAFTPIESNQWIFAVSIPEVEAYQSFRESLPYLILPFVAALILTYGAIFLVAGTLTRPIENLQEAVLNIAGGDLKVKAAEKSNDEIGSLARSFNKMTEDLNSNISKLAIEESERLSAEEANQAKSRFLSHMSHELRTPLNGILGYAQVLRKNRELAPKQQQMVDSIVNCGDYLLTLINDVLDLSKIEAGKMELDLAATDLHRLIMDVSDVVSMRAENKGLKFIVNISAEVPVGVLIDGSKVRQILINLLGNAVKFCEKGSIELKVSESPKGQLSFSVIDTGLGISVEQQKNVFAAFKQAEGGKKAGGTGLGLAIAKQLSESMSGALTFSSELAVGTTFTLAIPFEEVEHDALSTKEDFGNYDSTVKCLAQGQDFTILVVDDRQTNREVLEQLLEMTGFKTILADDGDTALDILQKEKIDLVLMDVRMPRLNGVEALKEIRQDSKLKDLLVFAVTASVFPDFHEKALKVGFDDFIGKPFKASELFEKLKRHLKASFIYEEESEAHLLEKSAEDSEVSLPPEALDQFHQALEIKNITAMKKITDELMIDDRYKSSGEKIMSMLEGFEFDSLENFLKQSE